MPCIAFTVRIIKKLQAPDPSGKQVIHWDDTLRGFGVLCSGVSNTKTFIAQRDLPGGKARRVTVGAVAEISLDVARKRAADILDDLRRGRDPKKKSAVGTLRETLEQYLAKRTDLRPPTIRLYRLSVERYLKDWIGKNLTEITSDMVEEMHSKIVKKIAEGGRYDGRISSNIAMRVFRLLWGFAKEREPELPDNPVKRLRRQWYKESRRKGIVRDEDKPKFFAAVQALPNKVAADYVTLLLFTGLRMKEAASLTWEDVDLQQRVIHIPAARTKNRKDFTLPMNDIVHDMFVARRRLGDAKYVFPSNSASGHIADPKFVLEKVAETCGVKVTLHDLRRTFVTVAASTPGLAPLQLKSLINHATHDVTEGYAVFTVEALREPAQKVADRLKELCGIQPIEGATRMSRARK